MSRVYTAKFLHCWPEDPGIMMINGSHGSIVKSKASSYIGPIKHNYSQQYIARLQFEPWI